MPTETESRPGNSSSPPLHVSATHYCLLALPLLALANSFLLSWQEILRLAVVTLGLGLVFRSGGVRFRTGERPEEADAGWAVGRLNAGILATALMFSTTQFDPLIRSSVGELGQVDYWFPAISSVLILAAGVIAFRSRVRQGGAGSLSPDVADRVVLLAGASAIALNLGSLWVYGSSIEMSAMPAVKVAQCVALWHVVKWSYGPLLYLSDPDWIRSESRERHRRWRSAMGMVLLAFCLAILAGGGQTAVLFYRFEQAEGSLAAGDVEAAKQEFEEVRAMNRSVGASGVRDSVWNRLITIYSHEGARDHVGSILEEIEEHHLAFAAHAKTGRAYERAGRTAEAMAEYRLAVERGNEEADVVGKLADWYTARDDVAEYAWLSRNAPIPAEIDTADEGRSMFLGDVELANGNYRQAVEYYRAAVGSPNLGSWAWYKIGQAEASGGSPQRSLDSFGRALALDPTFADAAYLQGLSHLSLGDTVAAAGALRSALEILPGHLQAEMALADIAPGAALASPTVAASAELVNHELGRNLLLVSAELDPLPLQMGGEATVTTRWRISDMRVASGIRLFLNVEFHDRASGTIYRAVNTSFDFERPPATWPVGEAVTQPLSFRLQSWPVNLHRAGTEVARDIARQTSLPAGCGYSLQLGLIYPPGRRPSSPPALFAIEGLCME